LIHHGPREKAPAPGGRAGFRFVGAWGCLRPEAYKPQSKEGGCIVVWDYLLLQVATLKDLAGSISSAVKQIIIDIVDFLTPIASLICLGMIIIGAILIALRQEFYGIRLIIGGGIGLVLLFIVIPLLLGLLP
jgi:hypothetical protein